jgi:hypothetical protein
MGPEVKAVSAQHSVKLVPWDDQEFVRAYERAAEDLATIGMSLDHSDAPVEIQRRLRGGGYPAATCYCERSVELAMARRSRCVVSRDGDTPALLRH